MWFSTLRNLRRVTVVSTVANAGLVVLGTCLVFLSLHSCDRRLIVPFVAVSLVAALRIAATFKTAVAQEAAAVTILDSPASADDGASVGVVDAVVRHERKMRYKIWLWWTRFAVFVTMLQFFAAAYLMFIVAIHVPRDPKSTDCVLGSVQTGSQWKPLVLVLFIVLACSVAILQCFVGSDVLKWRSYYATKDDAWKAHYREVFDHGIREVLCCLGRVKYMSAIEEDEVFSVARLLGDLVAYRASGTGHLELLAGLALMQGQSDSPRCYEECAEAPEEQIQEAVSLHKFAEAAYTGPLLDFGRNPFLFPCVWLHRQGILTPWLRNRQPKLDGDNWWRGHATAFLKYVNLPPEVLRRGRVYQAKCEPAYFVLVLHHLRSIVIAVRGTETPEDLIIDGLCRECSLSAIDIQNKLYTGYLAFCGLALGFHYGLLRFKIDLALQAGSSNHVHSDLEQGAGSSSPHYGHSGIVEAARNLFQQIEGNEADDETDSCGLLSSLLGAGCECEGYNVRIVGHSLGGSIAALLGIRMYQRYPNIHVYAYGPLPCVDTYLAEACSQFVTSIVLNNEFSSRLSIGSILRLRAAAITALAHDSSADMTMIFRLARRFLYGNTYQRNEAEVIEPDLSSVHSRTIRSENLSNQMCESHQRYQAGCDQQFSLFNNVDTRDSPLESDPNQLVNPLANEITECDDPVTEFMETVPESGEKSARNPPEVYLPGLVIHIVRSTRNLPMPLWRGLGFGEKLNFYKAYIANRESFKDIVVSSSMFLDHLPWRCLDAMQKVLEERSRALNAPQIVDVY